jgi:hypothetical protein
MGKTTDYGQRKANNRKANMEGRRRQRGRVDSKRRVEESDGKLGRRRQTIESDE